jgi:predicted proteasome-type protease
MVREVLISLDSTMKGKLSVNLIPPTMLRNIGYRWLHFMC